MANPDAPKGLQIWGPLLRQRLYGVEATLAVALFHGHMVITESKAVNSKFGNYTAVISRVTGGTSEIVGAVTALFDYNMDPVLSLAATAGDGIMTGYAMVADHPQQEFVVQEDGDGAVCGIADAGQNADMIATSAGNTGTGVSGWEMDSSSVAVTATLALQLLNPVPDQDATVLHCDWIVRLNAHFTGNNIAGV
jgi:hypothetical protein